jgi:hypothetical protein
MSKPFEGVVAVGEELFGPYLWEVYDLCVMPPGFPFGGEAFPLAVWPVIQT